MDNVFCKACISEIIERLKKAQIIALPTESVYGLSSIVNPKTVAQVMALKKRSSKKGFIIVSANIEHLLTYIDTDQLSDKHINLLKKTSAKPTTWVAPIKKQFRWLSGEYNSVAVRLTTHPLLTEVTNALDQVIISTSANLSELPPATTFKQVEKYFGNKVDYIYQQQEACNAKPSQIIDLLTQKMIRA